MKFTDDDTFSHMNNDILVLRNDHTKIKSNPSYSIVALASSTPDVPSMLVKQSAYADVCD